MVKFFLGNLKGPKGDRGPQGPRGLQGPRGADGADGRTADVATRTSNGLMSKEDKVKLDGMSGALAEIKDLYTEQNDAIDGNTTRLKNANNKLEAFL